MRFFEIFVLKEENNNTNDRKFVEKIQEEFKFETIEESKLFYEFLRRMKKNTNSKLVKFLFSNPMYRAESYSKSWSVLFGEKSCPTNRHPVDSTPQLQELIDKYLKSKGFTALRSNSIFVTGNLKFAQAFQREEKEIHVIFPSKNFSFTWNPKISDFYIHMLRDIENLELDYEKMLSNEKEKVLKFFEKTLMKAIYYDLPEVFKVLKEIFEGKISFQFPKEIENEKNFSEYSKKLKSLNEKMIFYKILNYLKASNTNEKIEHMQKLLNFLSKKNFKVYRSFFEYFLFSQLYGSDEILYDIIPKYLKIKENSKIGHFMNSNLEDAIASGKEIMINCDVYYYIEYDFFHRYSKKIEKFLDEVSN